MSDCASMQNLIAFYQVIDAAKATTRPACLRRVQREGSYGCSRECDAFAIHTAPGRLPDMRTGAPDADKSTSPSRGSECRIVALNIIQLHSRSAEESV